MNGLQNLTWNQILQLASGAQGFSNFDGGNNALGVRAGYKAAGLDYMGDEHGSLLNSVIQPFAFTIVNSADAPRSFFLSWGRNATLKGHLVSGAFDAIEDATNDHSLTATSDISTQSINDIMSFARDQTYGVFCPTIEVETDEPEKFLSSFIEFTMDFNPLIVAQPVNKKVRSYAEPGKTYHNEYLTLKDEFYISKYNKVKFTVPAGGQLSLTLHFAVAANPFKEFQSQITSAAADAVQNPGVAQAIANSQVMARLAAKGVIAKAA